MWTMSRTAAPCGDVISPTHCGRTGSGFLRSGSKRPSASRRIKLIFAARFIDADRAAHSHVQAVFGPKLEAGKLRAKTDAANLRVIVLQGEVKMAGLRGVGVGDFAFNKDVGEFTGEQVADAPGEVAHGPDGPARHQRKLKLFGHG